MNSLQDSSLLGGTVSPAISDFEALTAPGGSSSARASATNVVFVDRQLQNYEQLVSGMDGADVVLLDSQRDGIEQITTVLAQRQDLNSIQIFSHGKAGAIQLGNTILDGETLDAYRQQLQQWGQALTDSGDLLLHGCNVASGAVGQELIQQLSRLTQADVVASDDLTGQGGDWELEIATGDIETRSALNELAQANYQGKLAIYNGKEYVLTTAKTWEEAQAEAVSLGGNLVTINDAAEEAWLRQTFGETEDLWIGLTDKNQEGQFEWANGEAVTYTNWAPGQPDDYQPIGGEDYAALNFRDTEKWNDAGSLAKYRGIVELNQAGQAGIFGLQASNIIVNEGESTATVTVLRTQGASGTVTLDYSTVAGSAIAGQDYVAQSGTLTFAPGETSQSVEITLLDDNLTEGSEAFGFAIDNPSGGTLLAPRTAQVTVRDDESVFTYNGNTYRFTSGQQSWEAAQAEAVSLGGNLVTVNNAAEQAWLEQTFGSTEELWIGLTDKDQEGTFVWASGEAVTYTNWAPGQPDDYQPIGGEDYASLNFRETKQWNDAGDNARYRGLIEIPSEEPVPGNGNGLRAEYYDNIDFTDLKVTRTDSSVNFDWETGVPSNQVAADTFSVRWSGQIEPLYSETYTFQTTTDDGVRLWVNGELIVDQFVNQPPTAHTGTITLVAGERYDIRMDYYENRGGALAQLSWSSPSQTLEVVPQSQLYSDPVQNPAPELVRETVISDLFLPTAMEWTPDASKIFVAEKSGVVKVFENGALNSTPFIDISDQVNGERDRGLLDIAVHPDFQNTPYIYLLFTYDPPEVFENQGDNLAKPDGRGNRAGRLIRVTADAATNFTTAIPGSEVVLLGTNSTWDNFNGFANSTFDFTEPPAGILPDGTNVQDFLAADSESHTVGSVEFGPDGLLYVTNGDGTSYNRVDPRTFRVQDIDNLSGKVLRIDPITGEGVASNPFYNGDADANRSKVYQYGLRNPFRMAVDNATGKVYVGDVGWTQWEEINSAPAGANFGWPYYEGGNGTPLQTGGYNSLPESQAFYNSGQTTVPALLGLNHASTGINAIVMGDVYNGDLFPSEYKGDLFFNDLGQGIVRNVSFDAAGNVTSVEQFTTGANIVVQINEGPDGNLYFVDLDDGEIGRWTFA